ncbi:helix-turn-helix transcriptional regulator [Frigoribacterium sp. VKM Ac-1396]|uniref:helix-turn-helix transcriptional regulator n=1 Tax=Frigoribacterium sp. VKM Ac-1396 TaxID=2783821 RepID=UPI00188BD526|nr:helix-turn-helix transcriptional regulator [Frigoribacterium sp. VKM Ac-1396]MBF4600461.1 helix-turn-helix transcriptional regulator [Frigoribacterium sp. VKM Ac-1396]
MTADAAPPAGFRVGGVRPEAAVRAFELGYEGRDLAPGRPGDDFSWQHVAVGSGPVSLVSCRFGASLRGTVRPPDDYVAAWFSTGGGVVDVGRAEVGVRSGEPFAFPSDREFTFDYDAYRLNLLHLDRRWLAWYASVRDGREPTPIRLRHDRALGGDQRTAWRKATATLAEVLLGSGTATALAVADATAVAADTLLDVFAEPAGGSGGAGAAAGPGVSPALVARRFRLDAAVQYIEAHADRPISAVDVAEAIGVSARVLQSTFQQQLGHTPTAHLRGVRLQRAHDELAALDGRPGETVGAVARRWGFAHLGRFSERYAREFGERPSDTLGGPRTP